MYEPKHFFEELYKSVKSSINVSKHLHNKALVGPIQSIYYKYLI